MKVMVILLEYIGANEVVANNETTSRGRRFVQLRSVNSDYMDFNDMLH